MALILFLGDSHGHINEVRRRVAAAHKAFGISAAIQVGDFGFYPNVMSTLNSAFAVPTYVIDGNHEDHHWLNTADLSAYKFYNLIYQPRGSVAHIGNATIGFLGGALNADRRQEWYQQWKKYKRVVHAPENPAWANYVTVGNVEKSISAFNTAKPSVIVTHSCPAGIGIGMQGLPALQESVHRFITKAGLDSGDMIDCGEGRLTDVWNGLTTKPIVWAFGHFHTLRSKMIDSVQFACCGVCHPTKCPDEPDPSDSFLLYDTTKPDMGLTLQKAL